MTDTTLISKSFKFENILMRKPVNFTASDYKTCIDKALLFLPDRIQEVVIKSETGRVSGQSELRITIYWLEAK